MQFWTVLNKIVLLSNDKRSSPNKIRLLFNGVTREFHETILSVLLRILNIEGKMFRVFYFLIITTV